MKHLFFLSILLPALLFGQTDSAKHRLVNGLTKDIRRLYVNERLANAMCDTVIHKLAAGGYDTTLTMDEFVFEVNQDLLRVSKDHHISVLASEYSKSYFDEPFPDETRSKSYRKRYWRKIHRKDARHRKKYRKRAHKDMFTYGDIKILPGNIGYVETKDFESTSPARKQNRHRIKFESVLKYLSKTDAIIIDFRENLGGFDFLSRLFCSYFSETPYTYFLSSKYVARYDSSNIRKEMTFTFRDSTYPKITNQLTRGKKIFILTSQRTFSAAEITTYKLKRLNPDIIVVGEKTTGGGNGYYGRTYGDYYTAIIPCVSSFDEENNNYTLEAHGIQPDITAHADSAFSTAYHLALLSHIDTAEVKTRYYKKPKQLSEKQETEFSKRYPNYPGNYRKATITLENRKIYMTYGFYAKQLLIPDAPDYFSADHFEYVRFIRNEAHEVVEIALKHKHGYLEKFRRLSD